MDHYGVISSYVCSPIKSFGSLPVLTAPVWRPHFQMQRDKLPFSLLVLQLPNGTMEMETWLLLSQDL